MLWENIAFCNFYNLNLGLQNHSICHWPVVMEWHQLHPGKHVAYDDVKQKIDDYKYFIIHSSLSVLKLDDFSWPHFRDESSPLQPYSLLHWGSTKTLELSCQRSVVLQPIITIIIIEHCWLHSANKLFLVQRIRTKQLGHSSCLTLKSTFYRNCFFWQWK